MVSQSAMHLIFLSVKQKTLLRLIPSRQMLAVRKNYTQVGNQTGVLIPAWVNWIHWLHRFKLWNQSCTLTLYEKDFWTLQPFLAAFVWKVLMQNLILTIMKGHIISLKNTLVTFARKVSQEDLTWSLTDSCILKFGSTTVSFAAKVTPGGTDCWCTIKVPMVPSWESAWKTCRLLSSKSLLRPHYETIKTSYAILEVYGYTFMWLHLHVYSVLADWA